jgi:hypothetical protein
VRPPSCRPSRVGGIIPQSRIQIWLTRCGFASVPVRTESATLRAESTAGEMLAVYCSLARFIRLSWKCRDPAAREGSRLGATSGRWVEVFLVSQVGCLTSRRGMARVRAFTGRIPVDFLLSRNR